MDIAGNVALVTGAAKGLGLATTKRLIAAGADVIMLDRDDAVAGVAAELGAEHAVGDITSADEVSAALGKTDRPVRAVVHCAGIAIGQKTVSKGQPHDLDDFRKVIEVNLIGTFNVVRLAAAQMAAADPIGEERGVIVNTASVAAFDGQIGQVAYAASKGAVAAMTLPMARDLSRDGIRVCTIAPGTFDTPMLGTLPDEIRKALAAAIPNPSRLGDPDEYAQLALHIIENAYLNGETIRLDGALRMAPR